MNPWMCVPKAGPAIAAVLAVMLCAVEGVRAQPAWWDVEGPASGRAEAFGKVTAGCLAGSRALPLNGDGFQLMRPSRNRFHGHEAAIGFVRAFAAKVRDSGDAPLLIGDLAQPRGGPMRSDHRSHQTGLDIDIWFRPAPAEPLPMAEREEMSATSMINEAGTAVNGHWTPREGRLIEAAARFPEVARVIVHPAIKRELCRTAGNDRNWLGKVRPWWGHNAHFHVRLGCPAGSAACVDQDAPPNDDDCGEALTWWFAGEDRLKVIERKTPPPPPLRLDQLPPQCRRVLNSH
jgi:penicillin-insensitive murein endopeptidase